MNHKGLIIGIILVLGTALISYLVLTKIPPIGNNNYQIKENVNMDNRASQASKTSEELKIEDLKVGSGREVKPGDVVVMHYLGTLLDGTKFDSSYERNQPFETQIGVGQVIQGWNEGVPGMKIGGKRRLIIPSDLGYGARGAGDKIPPNSTLIFEVELLDIK